MGLKPSSIFFSEMVVFGHQRFHIDTLGVVQHIRAYCSLWTQYCEFWERGKLPGVYLRSPALRKWTTWPQTHSPLSSHPKNVNLHVFNHVLSSLLLFKKILKWNFSIYPLHMLRAIYTLKSDFFRQQFPICVNPPKSVPNEIFPGRGHFGDRIIIILIFFSQKMTVNSKTTK